MTWAAGDMDRRLQGLVRMGRVVSVDPGAARAVVTFGGETESAPLPWLSAGASVVREWSPPGVGEQVAVISASGDTANGVIAGRIYGGGNAPPSTSGDHHRLQVGDAAVTVEDGRITLAAGGVTLTLSSGGVQVDADVVAEGVSLVSHTHTGDSGGGTSPPR